MGNAPGIEGSAEKKMETVENRIEALMAEIEELEKKQAEIEKLKENNRDRADSYYIDDLQAIDVELEMIIHEINALRGN
jgi:hypothetical protein